MQNASERILGYEVFTRRLDHCVRDIADLVQSSNKSRWLACLNPHAYATALRRPDLAVILSMIVSASIFVWHQRVSTCISSLNRYTHET